MSELPLFPLSGVLLPYGRLPLQMPSRVQSSQLGMPRVTSAPHLLLHRPPPAPQLPPLAAIVGIGPKATSRRRPMSLQQQPVESGHG